MLNNFCPSAWYFCLLTLRSPGAGKTQPLTPAPAPGLLFHSPLLPHWSIFLSPPCCSPRATPLNPYPTGCSGCSHFYQCSLLPELSQLVPVRGEAGGMGCGFAKGDPTPTPPRSHTSPSRSLAGHACPLLPPQVKPAL